MVLYWTRSHSFVRLLGCGTTVLLPNKRSGREVQPFAALYPTVKGLALGDRSEKISTPGCGPPVPPDLYSTLEVHPTWFPLVPSDWGIWASPLETDQDSCPGWLPQVPLNLVSPQEGFSPGTLTPRFKHFPTTTILPLLFVCFLCGTWHRAFMRNHCQLEEFINSNFKIPCNVDYVTES